MKRVVFLMSLCLIYILCTAQTLSNVRFEQVNDKVKITYSLDKTADISVCVSIDGGKTWSAPLKKVSGDVGKSVSAGSRTIWWDVLEERENIIGNNICFEIIPKVLENITFTVGDVSFTMVYVEGGTFMMGATEEQGFSKRDCDWRREHEVTLTDYFIAQTEVTTNLWQAVMGTTLYDQYKNTIREESLNENLNHSIWLQRMDFSTYPIVYVNWYEAKRFCSKLSNLTGRTFMLPTEAQWEYAARGGKYSNGYIYAGSNNLDSVAQHTYKGGVLFSHCQVATKAHNELGLYDMSGNVGEWCLDWLDWYSLSQEINPINEIPATHRVIRGGWIGEEKCRVADRFGKEPNNRSGSIGFRIVLMP